MQTNTNMITTTTSISILIFLAILVFVLAAAEHQIVQPMCEGMMIPTSNWELAEKNFNDDECLSTWDEITGGIKAILSLDKFKNSDRKNLIDRDKDTRLSQFKVCVKKLPNYTLNCPSDPLYVTGCNGTQYMNACFAERDGIYTYITDNGLTATEE